MDKAAALRQNIMVSEGAVEEGYVMDRCRTEPETYAIAGATGERDDPRRALAAGVQRAVRLSANHYLVRWSDPGQLWCVVNMAALDEHAVQCSAFRYRLFCEHLRLIGELCTREGPAPPQGSRDPLAD
jgi:hypothetical protein